MKKMIYIFLLFLSINILSSDWEFGVKAGLNYNHFEFTELYGRGKGFYDRYDFLLGGVGRKKINSWITFNIEALYNRKSFLEIEVDYEVLFRIYYLDFPISFIFQLYNFEFQIGGYISKYIADCAFIDIYNETYGEYGKDRSEWNELEQEVNSWDVGYILGFGYRFKSFLIEARYSRSIRDQNSDNPFGIYSERLDYFDQWSFNIGYFF